MMKDCDAMASPRCWCHSGGVTMSSTEHLPFLYYGVGLLPGSIRYGQLAAIPRVIIMQKGCMDLNIHHKVDCKLSSAILSPSVIGI